MDLVARVVLISAFHHAEFEPSLLIPKPMTQSPPHNTCLILSIQSSNPSSSRLGLVPHCAPYPRIAQILGEQDGACLSSQMCFLFQDASALFQVPGPILPPPPTPETTPQLTQCLEFMLFAASTLAFLCQCLHLHQVGGVRSQVIQDDREVLSAPNIEAVGDSLWEEQTMRTKLGTAWQGSSCPPKPTQTREATSYR